LVPYGDENGEILAVLHNAAGDLGVSLGFNIQQLPVYSLWKNTDPLGQAYVMGLEPGTSWPTTPLILPFGAVGVEFPVTSLEPNYGNGNWRIGGQGFRSS
jgi:hypothetical protein